MGWWMGVGYWENLEEGEEEEEDEGQKEGKKKSRGSIDRFLAYSFLFLFLPPFSFDVFFQYFSLGRRRPSLIIQPVDHISRLNISLSLFPLPKGSYGPPTPGTEIFFFFCCWEQERGRERGGGES